MHDPGSRYAEQIVATVSQPLVVLTGGLEVETVNDAFCRTFRVSPEESRGRQFYDLGNGQWDIPELRRLLGEVLAGRTALSGYRVDHDFETIGRRVMYLNARRMQHDEGPDRILLTINDLTEVERQRAELEARAEFSEKLIDSIREGLLVLDKDLTVVTANESFHEMFNMRPADTEGARIYDLGNGQWNIPDLREALEGILPREERFNDYEVERDFEGLGRRVMLLNARRLDHRDQILLAFRDVTERREQQHRQHVFVAELQHRVKNILGNVHALANQTRRHSRDLDAFFDAFTARLSALSRTQDLLVRSPQEAAEIGDILRAELEAVGAVEGRSFTLEGPEIRLNPRDTQAIAMAVHELATNAGKYGALRAPGGCVRVAWWIGREAEKTLHFRWRETGVTIRPSEAARGFGSDVITRSVPHMLGGTADLSLHPDGAHCRLSFPLPDGKEDG